MPDDADDKEMEPPQITTEQLNKKLNDLIESQAKAREERNKANNRLQILATAMTESIGQADRTAQSAAHQIDALAIKQDALCESFGHLEKRVTALDHIMRGVDGNNGMRAEIKAIRVEQKDLTGRLRFIEVRVAVMVALFLGGGFGAVRLLQPG